MIRCVRIFFVGAIPGCMGGAIPGYSGLPFICDSPFVGGAGIGRGKYYVVGKSLPFCHVAWQNYCKMTIRLLVLHGARDIDAVKAEITTRKEKRIIYTRLANESLSKVSDVLMIGWHNGCVY
ncbi:uncharacterized protein EDB91DRAFT_1085104 [Suillus paluster]|uniref:uncharacterized protein n=1 Tax=Suillus paluster TaxID=48578 RepID=UPI001B85FC20|nr:uncharacterized protein EDB91DRAFT_1085104 [Suillus paluster]KAG1731349.1 hypothetical protein EDB91DRAFT_1085104 [Suillus paluster]